MTGNASTKSMYENRLKHLRNPLIGYLNINSLRNKIVDVREVFGKLQLDCFVLSETKLDDISRNMKQKLVKPLLLSLPYQRKSSFVLASIGHPLRPT